MRHRNVVVAIKGLGSEIKRVKQVARETVTSGVSVTCATVLFNLHFIFDFRNISSDHLYF